MTYPPTYLTSDTDPLSILQISDLHLFADINAQVLGNHCQQSFEKCLSQALSRHHCDLILLTGDLVSEPKSIIYDRIFATLEATNVPFACIAGNHDVTLEMGMHLPFFQRQFIACSPDSRLLSRHVIETPYWQILLLDSSIAGKVEGQIKSQDLLWLKQQLQINKKPALIALHHHVTLMNSHWIDQHILKNADMLWDVLLDFPHVKAIINGHAHQENEQQKQNISVYTTPSACYQFKPKQDTFDYDTHARAGYRWLYLYHDGSIKSTVERLQS